MGCKTNYIRGGHSSAQCVESHLRVAFRQPAPLGVANERQVDKFGWIVAEQSMKVDLLSRRVEQVAAANNFCDSHQRIVDNNGELIGPGTVGTAKHEVATLAVEPKLPTTKYAVGKTYGSVVGDI